MILTVAACLALPLMDRLTLRWFARDLTLCGEPVANALSESVADALQDTRGRKQQALFDRALQDERMVAIGWCSTAGRPLRRSQSCPPSLSCEKAASTAAERARALCIEGGPGHVTVHAITAESGPMG